MAGNTDKRQRELEILINGQQADASLNDLTKASRLLNKEIKGLTPGSQEFINKSKDLDKVTSRMNQVKKSVRSYGKEQSRASKLLGSFKKGVLDLAAKGGAALLAFFAVQKIVEFGQHIDQVSRKFLDLRKNVANVTGASGESLDQITSKVAALADSFDKDYNEVLQASNALAQQMGISQAEALSLIEKGFIQGADANGDFLDKVKEYPVQFRQAGRSAEEFIKVAVQEVRGGVFSDKLLDSVKETNLRLSELTTTQQDALRNAFGNAFTDQFIQQVKTGELNTKQAFMAIQAEADRTGLSVTQMQTLVADLGGGPVEDLGGLEEAFKQLDAAARINLDTLTEQQQKQQAQLQAQEALAAAQNEVAKAYEDLATSSDLASTNLQTLIFKVVLQAINIFKAFKAEVEKVMNPIIARIQALGERIKGNSDILGSFRELLISAFQLAIAPITLTFNIITKVVEVLVDLYEQSALVRTIIRSLGERLKLSFKLAASFIKFAADQLSVVFDIAKSILTLDFKGFFQGVGKLFVNFGKQALSIFTDIKESIENTFNTAAAQKRAEEARLEEIKKAQAEQKRLRQEELREMASRDQERIQQMLDQGQKEREAQKQQRAQADQEAIAAAQAQAEKLRQAREEFAKKEQAATRAVEDLENTLIKDRFEREIAQLKTKHEREVMEIEEQGVRVAELKTLKEEELNQRLAEIELARQEAQKEKRAQDLQEELEKNEEDFALRREQEEEQFLTTLETQAERDLAVLDLQAQKLESELDIKRKFGNLTAAEEKRLNNQIFQAKQERAQKEEEFEQKRAEALGEIRQAEVGNLRSITDLTISLFGESKAAKKAALLADAAFAIADVVIDTQKAIVGFTAATKFLGLAQPAAIAAYTAQANIRKGISIATIAAQTALKFSEGGILPTIRMASGGLLSGPSHAQGGIRVPGTNIELEGQEYVVNKISTFRNRPALEAINAHPNVKFAVAPIQYQEGGQLPGSGGSAGLAEPGVNLDLSQLNNQQMVSILSQILVAVENWPTEVRAILIREEFRDAESRDQQTRSDNQFG